MKLTVRLALSGLLILTLGAGQLGASGFSIFEQSAKASGLAGAWVARADDAAANWYNPAALLWLEGSEVQFGGNIITVGGDTEFTALDPSFGIFTPTVFEPESSLETPIHFYYRQKVSPGLAWGIGLTTPFGLVTEWAQRPVTFSAAKSELTTFVLNPNVAVAIGGGWALGLGVDYIFADIGSFSREVPIDLDGNPLNGFEVIGAANLTGDGNDIGFNVALHRKGPGWGFGLTYRTELSPEIEGDIAYSGFGPLSPFFPSSPGSAGLNLPAQAQVGLAWETSGPWSFEVDVAWAGWSDFDTLIIDITNETAFSRDIVLREAWDDTFSYRFGAARAAGANEWRFGVVLDESPVPEDTLRPSIPDAERTGASFGWGHKGPSWNVDLYYMALWFDDITAVGNEEGVIRGTYSSFTNLAGVTVSRRF